MAVKPIGSHAGGYSPFVSSGGAAIAAAPRVYQVLIVDDHPLVRQGLRALLETQPDFRVSGEAEDIRSALQELEHGKPEVLIVDISLKECSGLELIHRIRAKNLTIPILVVSMYDEKLFAERSLAAGAQGYVSKQQAPETVVTALRQVLAGRLYVSAELTSQLLTRAVTGKAAVAGPRVASLSDRELEVYEQIGQGQTTSEIADRLKLSAKTVETHRLHIREKLNLADNSKLIRDATQWVLERRAGGTSNLATAEG
ncbi:MAG: response regulator transcription factor [Planctomycetota bacterium]|nr:response regulator transcription factor [Planctomycetota bacterium]